MLKRVGSMVLAVAMVLSATAMSYADNKEVLYKIESAKGASNLLFVSSTTKFDKNDETLMYQGVTGNSQYIVLNQGLHVKGKGLSIKAVDLTKPHTKSIVSDGMYLIGYDLKPGKYKLLSADADTFGYIGYYSRVLGPESRDWTINNMTGLTIVEVKDSKIIEITEDTKMVQLTNCQLTKIK